MELHEMKDHGGLEGESHSFWVASTPATDYPPLRGEVVVDAAVIGGGIVGITAAALLRRAGASVALIEGDRLARAVTGHTTAKITSLHRLIYAYLVEEFGREKARQYAEANQAGLEKVAELVREHGIDCDFARRPFYTYAGTEDGLRRVEAEAEAARGLGLPADYTGEVPLDVPARGAVRFGNQAQFHPRRYLLGLARTVPGDRSFVFERSRVTEVEDGRPCRLRTETGTVRADRVIIATHYPIAAASGFYFARLHQERHYALAFTAGRPFPEAMLIAAEEPGYAWRAAPSEEGELVILSGYGHKTGEGGDTRQYYRKLVEEARRLYPEAEFRWHWATQDVYTVDRVPYIGRLTSGSERLYTATGFAAWGMAAGTAAAQILTDLIRSGFSPWAPVFDPRRFTPQASAREFLKQNLDAVRTFIGGRIAVPKEQTASVAEGEGKVIQVGDRRVGVFRDPDGKLFGVDPVCRHLGCLVEFNPAEKTWDCPCHGSRYAPDGSVLEAPAMHGLPRVDLGAPE